MTAKRYIATNSNDTTMIRTNVSQAVDNIANPMKARTTAKVAAPANDDAATYLHITFSIAPTPKPIGLPA
jgi:hypothetical protein